MSVSNAFLPALHYYCFCEAAPFFLKLTNASFCLHHLRILFGSTTIFCTPASLLFFSAHSMAFNLREKLYDLLLHIPVPAATALEVHKILRGERCTRPISLDPPFIQDPVYIQTRPLFGTLASINPPTLTIHLNIHYKTFYKGFCRLQHEGKISN